MSLKLLARELGLSVTTVSRALNGYDDVAADTKQRVHDAAQRMGYRPNTLARRLKMGKIDAVGLLFPFGPRPLNNSAFIEMVGCISQALAQHEIDLLLLADEGDAEGMARLIGSKRIDALLVAHTLAHDPRLATLQQLGFPFLALGRSELAHPYAWFDFDNHAGTRLAVEHLADLGHRRIAYLGETSPQSFVAQRRQGFLDAMQARNLPLPPACLGRIQPTRRAGYQATQALLALPEPPTAIITDNNMHGEGAVMALHEAGLLESGRVSLVIYDGLPPDSLIDLPITAVVQSTREEVGHQIAAMMLALIRGEPLSQLQVLWQPTLCRGVTSWPPC